MSLAEADLAWLQTLLDRSAGITLDAAKTDRVGMRLMPVAQRAGLASVEALIARARIERSGPLVDQIVDAIATHETSWFRDIHPWLVLTSVLVPQILKRLDGRRPMRIWSAACSSGQEPYSIALALTEALGPLADRVEILASDYSAAMVSKASDGRYTQLEMNRGVPTKLMLRHFSRDGAYWRLNDNVRRLVRFEQRNLTRPLNDLPTIDIVCLRNVLIYFDVALRERILNQVETVIDPDGWLMLGATETLLGMDGRWDYATIEATMLYQPRPQSTFQAQSQAPSHTPSQTPMPTPIRGQQR